MKISKIDINNYNQFKNLTIDLSYPKGHQKEGRPLDKVCFIGQSGTGKTTLLNLIRAVVSSGLIDKKYVNENMTDISVEAYFDNHKQLSKIEKGHIQNTLFFDDTKKMDWEERDEFLLSYYSKTNVAVVFPAEINTDFNSILSDDSEKIEFLPLKDYKKGLFLLNKTEMEVEEEFKNKIFDFEMNNVKTIWELILADIQKYKVANLSFRSELTNKVQNGELAPENLVSELNKWEEQNPNPLRELASKLNIILNKFNLEIKPEPDFKSADDLKFIKVHQIDGKEIPNNYWSTGTKQLVLTATPLIELSTDKSIVLIDEPERSFYPNIQQEIVNFYTELAPNAQFFIATHSPIIASSFEPWEIVELKFDENGEVYQDVYYKGERHIDNYYPPKKGNA